MPYTPNTWVDRNVQYPTRYTDELANVKTFTPSPGTVTEAGTTVTAAKMNNIEEGIDNVTGDFDTHEADDVKHKQSVGVIYAALYANAEGYWTTANGDNSHAEGNQTTASGASSHAEGAYTDATGLYSHAAGNGTRAKYAQTVIGMHNTVPAGLDSSYEATSELFIIGNGINQYEKGNAFKVLGNGNVYADGAYSGTGADYAEYFEWIDGNPNDEDRVGYFVTMDGEKIRKAISADSYILGIVSANPSIIGDDFNMRWKDKYLTDEWGRVQYHEVLVPAVTETRDGEEVIVTPEHVDKVQMINPDWDSNREYISREKRKEWSPVGMVGKLLVRDDGTCMVNGRCWPNDEGIATANESGYRVMKRVKDNIVLVLVK